MDLSPALSVDDLLHAFVERELLPGTGVEAPAFWASLEKILSDFTPRNLELLGRRDELQARIDRWHGEQRAATRYRLELPAMD